MRIARISPGYPVEYRHTENQALPRAEYAQGKTNLFGRYDPLLTLRLARRSEERRGWIRVRTRVFCGFGEPGEASGERYVGGFDGALPAAVRLQFRNFALEFHPQAGLAHEAATDAVRQGGWEFEAFILEHQDTLREQDLMAYAAKLGLDEKKFPETIRQRRYSSRVEVDLEDGAKRGLRGSPVIFVNGKRIDGVPSLAMFTVYVEAELAAKAGLPNYVVASALSILRDQNRQILVHRIPNHVQIPIEIFLV